jgi:hypothetical protein
MLRLTERRRAVLAETSVMANHAVAALVLVRAVGQNDFSPMIAIVGIGIWSLFIGITHALAGERR